jgi:hypothetical protein
LRCPFGGVSTSPEDGWGEHERIDPYLVSIAKAQLGEVVDESLARLPKPEGHRAIRVHHHTAPADHVPQFVEEFNQGDRVGYWVGTVVHKIQGTRSVPLPGMPNDAESASTVAIANGGFCHTFCATAGGC